MVELLARRAAEGGAILGFGARPESWQVPRWPTREQIEQVAGGRVLVAWCFDFHALIASRAALERAGIHEDSADPPGGVLERDRAGRLTGVVLEKAAGMVWDALPEPGHDERRRSVSAAVSNLVAEHGFAELHDLKSQTWLGPVLADIAHELPDVRFFLWPLLGDLERVLETRARWETDRVRLGGAKIFVDGTLNSRTAWVLEAYADGRADHPHGKAMMSQAEIEDAVRRCDEAGVPLAAHAIGDAAVRAVLDAIERVQPRTRGFRIEHCELIDEADVPRFARLGVIASVQPCHLLYDVEALRRGLPHRLGRVLPLRELIDSGLKPGRGVIFGSDVPIVAADPSDSVQAAVYRRRRSPGDCEPIAPEQGISEDEAWACFRSCVDE
ncbi:MAG: hypothetical protein Kow0022_17880 [Phycisphaerales bacterium]